MRYSVWQPDRKLYAYYEGSSTSQRGLRAAQVGVPVTEAAWPLPLDAQRVGEGTMPQGRIASSGSLLSLNGVLDFGTSTLVVIGLCLAAVGLYKVLK